jgi:hypothetical protein
MPLSAEFRTAVLAAVDRAKQAPDDSVRWMTAHIPVYIDARATPAQAAAGGCPHCTYLGLWAEHWPGYPPSPHGLVWLFEDGIRGQATQAWRTLSDVCFDVLVHEYGHALQRDHVLESLRGPADQIAARGCNCPGYPTR